MIRGDPVRNRVVTDPNQAFRLAFGDERGSGLQAPIALPIEQDQLALWPVTMIGPDDRIHQNDRLDILIRSIIISA